VAAVKKYPRSDAHDNDHSARAMEWNKDDGSVLFYIFVCGLSSHPVFLASGSRHGHLIAAA
jgi:hypothetical protein